LLRFCCYCRLENLTHLYTNRGVKSKFSYQSQAFKCRISKEKHVKLSTKGRYAVMAMVDIAINSHGDPVSLAAIAQRQDISQEYLEQLFGKLRKKQLVTSVRGPGGGYLLAKSADEMVVAEIVLAADEPLTVTRCQDGDAVAGCIGGEKCCTHELWAALGRQIYGFLAAITLSDVVGKRNLALEASIRRAKAQPTSMAASG